MMYWMKPACGAAALLFASLGSASATAQQGSSGRGSAPVSSGRDGASEPVVKADSPGASRRTLDWQRDWRRFHWAQGVGSGLAGAAALTMSLAWPEPEDPRWTGGILFDGATRSALRAGRKGARRRAGLASDVLQWALVSQSLIDAGVASLGRRGNPEVGLQLGLISGQTYALVELAGLLVKRLVARARPFRPSCETADPHPSCAEADLHQSFYSGHSARSFAAAGLICAQHRAVPLYGGGWRDMTACGAAMGAAASVGALRVVADEHYVSDVLVGAGAGVLFGYVLPRFLHFRGSEPWSAGPNPRVEMTLAPFASRGAGGLSLTGRF
jgi:membrane-associated phospholipid phosphatase